MPLFRLRKQKRSKRVRKLFKVVQLLYKRYVYDTSFRHKCLYQNCEHFYEIKVEKSLDFRGNMSRIYKEIAYSLIKSGGGNGPMKPGNLLIQGAKSGGDER